MGKINIFPDEELLIISGISSALQVPLGADGVRVVTRLPASIEVPTVRVTRISGASRNIIIDRPMVDIDTFWSDYGMAKNIARQVTVALFALRGVQSPMGVVTNVNVIQGPRFLPESDPNLYRVSASYEVFTHS